jgi:plasmid stabilization system protein ParE
MTPWTVESTSIAEDQLSDIWLHAPDQRAVTAAQAAIDRMLARDPLAYGKEVREGLRKLTVLPLTVYYEVRPAQQVVEIQAVAYTP